MTPVEEMTPAEKRRFCIIRLLESRDDGLPTLAPRPQSESGFADGAIHRETCDDCLDEPPAKLVCPTCHSRGYLERRIVHDPFKDTCPACLAKGLPMKGCKTCGGRGHVKHHHGPGVVAPYGLTPERREREKARDAEIERLRRQTQPPRSEADLAADVPPFPWERERARMWRDHDYPALDRALERLRDTDYDAYRALHAVYVYGWLRELSATVEAACERGLAFLDERLPSPLRAPGDEKHPALARRDSRRAA